MGVVRIKRVFVRLAAGLLLSAADFTAQALAADPDFCHDYADQAMRQAHIADEGRSCADFIDRDPARWRMDYDAHYSWCLRKRSKEVDRERNARTEILDQCVGVDWREHDHGRRDHDDDRGDDARHW